MDAYQEALMAGRMARPPKQEDKPKTAFDSATQTGASAMAGAANLLDLPGSVVRDTLTWLPGGLPAHNPFDQLLPWNWFSDKGRSTGREHLRAMGLAGDKDTWGNFVEGAVYEGLTDPLTYLSGGGTAAARALAKSTKLSKVKKAAGSMPAPIARHSEMVGKQATPTGMSAGRTTTIRDVVEDAHRKAQETGDTNAFDSLIKNLQDNNVSDDMLDTSIGGVSPWRIQNPFTGNPIKSVDKAINWLGRQYGATDDVIIDGVLGAKRYPKGDKGLADYAGSANFSPEVKKFYTNPQSVMDWIRNNGDAATKISQLDQITPEGIQAAFPGASPYTNDGMRQWGSVIKKALSDNPNADKIIEAEFNLKKAADKWNWLPDGAPAPTHPGIEIAKSPMGTLWRLNKKADIPADVHPSAVEVPAAKTFSDIPDQQPYKPTVSDYLSKRMSLPTDYVPPEGSVKLVDFHKKNSKQAGYKEFLQQIAPEVTKHADVVKKHIQKEKWIEVLDELDKGGFRDFESLRTPGVKYRKTLSPDKTKIVSTLLDEAGNPTDKVKEYPFENIWKYVPVQKTDVSLATHIPKDVADQFEKFSEIAKKSDELKKIDGATGYDRERIARDQAAVDKLAAEMEQAGFKPPSNYVRGVTEIPESKVDPIQEISEVKPVEPQLPAEPKVDLSKAAEHPLFNALTDPELPEKLARQLRSKPYGQYVEDATQDRILKAMEILVNEPDKFKSEKELKSFLYTAVKNKALDMKKKSSASELADEFDATDLKTPIPGKVTESLPDAAKLIDESVDAKVITPSQANVLKADLEGKANNDIAADLGVGASAISNQRSKGIDRIKSLYDAEEVIPDRPPTPADGLPAIGHIELMDKLKSVSGPKLAGATMRLIEARAKAAGETFDEYIGSRFADIRRDTPLDIDYKQAGKGNTPKGAIEFLEDGRAIIYAFKSSDASTMVHELGHVFRRDLDDQTLKSIEQWAGAADGKWSREAEEKFARGFEKYMATGEAPSSYLKEVFDKFKEWVTQVYSAIHNIGVDVSNEAKAAYDSLFTSKGGRATGTETYLSQAGKTPADSAQKFLEKIDSATDFISGSPLGVYMRALFTRGSMGATDPTVQKYAQKNTEIFFDSVEKAREQTASVARKLDDEPSLNRQALRELTKDMQSKLRFGATAQEAQSLGVLPEDIVKYSQDGVVKMPASEIKRYAERHVNKIYNDRINKIYDYLELGTDEVPDFLGPSWREGLDSLRRIAGTEIDDIRNYAEAMGVSLKEAMNALGGKAANSVLRDEIKNGLSTKELMDEFIDAYYPRAKSPETRTDIREFLGNLLRRFWSKEEALDVPAQESAAYNPRKGPLLDTMHSSQKGRKYTGIPGGTSTWNQLSTDETPITFTIKRLDSKAPTEVTVKFSGAANRLKTTNGSIPEQLVDAMAAHIATYPKIQEHLSTLDKQEAASFLHGLKTVAKAVATISTDHADLQKPLFSDNILGVLMNRIEHSKRTVASAKTLFSSLRDMAQVRDDIDTGIEKGQQNASGEAFSEMAETGNPTIGRIIRQKSGLDVESSYKIVVDMLGDKAGQVSDAIKKSLVQRVQSGKKIYLKDANESLRLEPNKDGSYTFYQNADKEGKIIPKETASEIIESIDIPPHMIADGFVVSATEAKALDKFIKQNVNSEEASLLWRAVKGYTTLWKTMHTGMFPAFHIRNKMSGTLTNMARGAFDPRFTLLPTMEEGKTWNPLRRYMQPVLDSMKANSGEYFDGMEKIPAIRDALNKMGNLSKEQMQKAAVDAYKDLVMSKAVIGGRQGIAAEQLLEHADAFRDQIPGHQWIMKDGKFNPSMSPVPGAGADSYNPLATRGVLDNENKFLPYRWGEQIGKEAEGVNRQAPFIAYLRQGYTPEMARDMVNLNQVDYTDLSNFEKDYARIAMPFFSYLKGSSKLLSDELMNHPGGAVAQSLRLANMARDDDPSVPEHIQETTAIPLGASADGTKNYITGLGLGWEDPVNAFTPLARGDLQGFARELVSRANPLAKAFIEGTTGVSTFQTGPLGARQLRELDPPIGRTLANIHDLVTGDKTEEAKPFISPEVEFAVAASPLSRVVNTARTAADPRKWENPLYAIANLLSGVKVNQVSPAAQDSVLAGRVAEKIREMGGRTYSRPYFPDNVESKWDARQASDANALMEILKGIDQRRKARRSVQAQS